MDVDKTMFQSVQVISDAGTAFLCLIQEKQVWVPLDEIHYGSELAQVGDRGRLFVSQWFARNLRLRVRSAEPAHPLDTKTAGATRADHMSGGRAAARRFRSETRDEPRPEVRSVRLGSRPLAR
jgi:hypothetical protein